MSQGLGGKTRRQRKGRARPGVPTVVQLDLPSDVRLYVSPKGFWRLCAANRELRLERTARGVVEAMPPAGSGTGASNCELTIQVGNWSKADGTGTAFDSSAGFTLPNGAVRSPDASWIVNERWKALTPAQRKVFAPICPDFVVELRSPSDALGHLQEKMQEYLEQGTRLGWLLDPLTGMVEIYRPSRPVERLERPSTLSGEDVLPGFVLDLKGILYD
ncbi:MAG: Uma2 family endonuclease [Isosphaeraceae bacterium]